MTLLCRLYIIQQVDKYVTADKGLECKHIAGIMNVQQSVLDSEMVNVTKEGFFM